MKFIITSFLSVFTLSSFAQTFNADYQLIVSNADKTIVTTTLQNYENLGVKSSGSTQLNTAGEWIIDKYEDWGYTDIEKHNFTYSGKDLYNIVITKTGKKYPNKYLVLSAHYDSINGKGANDNGTGTVSLLEIARLLKDIDTDYSIKFIHFSAEEQGLIGSKAFVTNVAVPQNMDILLVLNIDEVGGDASKTNNTIVCERDESSPTSNNSASDSFTQKLSNIVKLYTNLNTKISYAYASDYMSFEDAGYVITGLFEANETPHRHKSTDLVVNMDMDYYFEVVKGAVAATLHFANDEVVPVATNPKLVTLIPSDNAQDIDVNTTLQLDFDQNVVKGTGSITIKRYSDNTVIQTISLDKVAVNENKITIVLNKALPAGETCYVLIPNTAFKNSKGEFYAGITNSTQWAFTTLASAEPEPTAIDDDTFAKLKIYPNPTKDMMYVELPEQRTANTVIKIYDGEGNLVFNQDSTKSTVSLDLRSWSKGVYMLEIWNNGKKTTQKIVKN